MSLASSHNTSRLSASINHEEIARGLVRRANADLYDRFHSQWLTGAQKPVAVNFSDAMAMCAGTVGLPSAFRHKDITATLTSDDFVYIVQRSSEISSMIGYVQSMSDVMVISHENNAIANFKDQERVRAGMFPELKETPEGAEVHYGTFATKGETYRIKKFSRLLELTEEAVVNDDLGLLTVPAMNIGSAVADLHASELVALIEGNPTLKDGHSVFSAEHRNDADPVDRLGLDTLSYARTAMRRQMHIDEKRALDVSPKYLVVPPELETMAEQLVEGITANSVNTANPFARKLEVIVEPRLSSPDAWYLFADPARQLGLEHGGLEGNMEPKIRTEAPIGRHVVLTRVTVDFGCGWVDWRGVYRNRGTGSTLIETAAAETAATKSTVRSKR